MPVLTVEHDAGWLVVDELVEGFAWGGIRASRTASKREAAALARVMTRKNRVCGIEAGGAKAAIRSKERLGEFLRVIAPLVERRYTPGPDLGTTTAEIESACAGVVDGGRTAAAKRAWSLGARDEARLARVAAMRDGHGFGFEELRTGWGADAAIEAAARARGTSVVHGFGNAGAGLASLLARRGMKVVGIADAEGGIVRRAGVDVEALRAIRAGGIVDRARLPRGHEAVSHRALVATECDVLALAASTLEPALAAKVKAKVVACVANLAVAEPRVLERRGIAVLPDYLVNGGAVLAEYALLRGLCGESLDKVAAVVRGRIGGAVREVLAEARRTKRAPREIADARW